MDTTQDTESASETSWAIAGLVGRRQGTRGALANDDHLTLGVRIAEIGVASDTAIELGALAGRNWLLSLFTSLPSDGSVLAETTRRTIQSSTTRKRNRTTKRPRPEKNRFTGESYLCVWG